MIAGLEVLQSAVEVGTKSPQNVRKYGGPDGLEKTAILGSFLTIWVHH